jgi:preprotein translocase subunit Sec61beta
MADQSPVPPPATPPQAPATPPAPAGPTINIGEEYGTAKKNLPPAKIVLIAIAVVAVVVLIMSFVKRAKPQGSGSLDNVVAVEIPGQNSTMAALTFTLHNGSDKALYVHSLQGKVTTASGETTAEAVSAVDFDRYFQAFPALKNGAQLPLSPEVRLEVGQTVTRTIIVAFPITLDAFNQRKSVSAIIWPYNYTVPLILTK